MLKLFSKRCVLVPALAAVCWGTTGLMVATVTGAEVSAPACVLKHTAATGQSYSAVVLKVSELPQGVVARDHVILIDTSAVKLAFTGSRGLQC